MNGSGLDRANDPLIGTWILDQFHIVDVIGEGGMGRVYLADQVAMGRHVAIKVVHIRNSQMQRRFRNEARTMSRLVHPNLVTVYNFGEIAAGSLFLAMEYLEGQSLEVVMQQGPLPIMQAVNIAYQCAAALDCAHNAGIIHRDLKPENVIVTKVSGQDHVKVLDFGIAHWAEEKDITPAGVVIGTPQYMSPEQCRGEVTTALSDQYSLGLVLYEMLSGKPAFEADSLVAYLFVQQKNVVPPLALTGSIKDSLDAIIRRMTDKNAAARFACMRDVQTALEPIGEQLNALTKSWRGRGAVDTDRMENARPAGSAPDTVERPIPSVSLFGKGQPIRFDGRETIFDVGFEIVARLNDVKDLKTRQRVSDLWVVRTTDDRWDSTSANLRACGISADKILVAIDASVDSAKALASIARVDNVVIGHPADATPISVALRWMQRREASLIGSIATSGIQLIQITAAHLKSTYVDLVLEDLTARNIRESTKRAVKAVSEEMIMNAIFHAPVDAAGMKRYSHLNRSTLIDLDEREQPILQWAIGEQYLALSVRDRFGSLTPTRVTTALSRAVQVNPNGPSLTAGLGLSIMSRAARHLVVGVVSGESCEVLALIERDPTPNTVGERSVCVLRRAPRGEERLGDQLWIHEIKRDGRVHIAMKGEINETSDLTTIFQRTGDVWIDFAAVTAINSSGVLAWMNAHRGRHQGLNLFFERCPPPVVHQLSMVKDLAASGTIVSLQLPYFCNTCRKEVLNLLDTCYSRAIPQARCLHCSRELEFADLPELYLSLIR